MKLITILLLIFIPFILFANSLLIQKTDGSFSIYELENLTNISFNETDNELLQIHKIDASIDEIEISLIENIEFFGYPIARMVINYFDDSYEEVELENIIFISFNNSTENEDFSETNQINPIKLLGSYPNPFSITSSSRSNGINIKFDIHEPGFTQIDIFNLKGEKIKTVLQQNLDHGIQECNWSGLDENGTICPTGIYLYRISINKKHLTDKILLIK